MDETAHDSNPESTAKEETTMPDEKLYTLTEVAKMTSISMPTLQRYKKLYQSRIPSKGSGRSQRYPEEALEVFRELKTENIGRRGRPRKTAVAASAKKAAAAPAKRGRKPAAKKVAAPKKKAAAPKKKAGAATQDSGEELLTLTQISKLTKISYPTLLRYVKNSLKQIPHKGTGRSRRFLPGAVEVFKELRQQSKVGRKAGSGKKTAAKAKAQPAARKAAAGRRGPGRPKAVASDTELTTRVKNLEKALQKAERSIATMEKKLAKPVKAQVVIKGR